MPRIGPIKRKDMIYYLKLLGFDGPHSRSNHQYLMKGLIKVPIPNPHGSDIGTPLLVEILKQAGVSRSEWEKL